MTLNLRRRTTVRVVSFLAAGIVALGGTAIAQQRELYVLRQVSTNTYLRAFDQLTASVDKLDAALEKCVYATSGQMLAALSGEVYAQSLSAQQALGELPYANVQLEETAAFVAKTGDYASALAKSVAKHDGYAEGELDNVKALHQASTQLKERLEALENSLYDGTAALETVEEVEARLSALTEDGDILAGSSYQQVEAEFPELPTLIYDGPFSQHLQSRSAKLLEQEDEVTQAQACRAAAQWLGLSVDELQAETELNGEIPCWVFSGGTEEDYFTIDVTKQGGEVLSWGTGRIVGAKRLTQQEGMEAAARYLEEHGLTDLSPTYASERGNQLTVNFAAQQGEVTCYPDLVKVEVALDTGAVVGYEASGYLMNHTQRTLAQPAVTKAQAEQKISPELTVLGSKLAVVPTEGETEVLCWEFQCENQDGIHYIVYLNAATGEEQKLFRLIEDESGTLVI
jgi:germination protein YpeB